MKRAGRRRWPRVLAAVVLALMLVSIALTLLHGPMSQPNAEDVAYARRLEEPPAGEDFRVPMPQGRLAAGNGIVEPADEVTEVAAQVSGVIGEIAVARGDWVEAGELLVALEHGAELAAAEARQAEVDEARAALDLALAGVRAEERRAMASEAEAAEARADEADDRLARVQVLCRGGAATQEELTQARTTARARRAEAKAARARAKAAEAGSRPEEIREARARLSAAEARHAEARRALEQRLVRAPITGKVLEIDLQKGEYYTPGVDPPLLYLGDTRKRRVRMELEERNLGDVTLGARAFVTSEAYPHLTFPGTVAEVGDRVSEKELFADERTERVDVRVLEVVIDLEPTERLVIGQRVMAYVEPRAVEGITKGR